MYVDECLQVCAEYSQQQDNYLHQLWLYSTEHSVISEITNKYANVKVTALAKEN